MTDQLREIDEALTEVGRAVRAVLERWGTRGMIVRFVLVVIPWLLGWRGLLD